MTVTVANDLVPILQRLAPAIEKFLTSVGGSSTKQLLIGGGALLAGGLLARGGAGLAGRGLLAGARGLPGALALPGVALGLPVAAGGALAIQSSYATENALSEALGASSRVNPLDAYSRSLPAGLKAQRLKIERLISGIEPGGTESSLLGPRLTGEYLPAQQRQLAKLQAERTRILAQIDRDGVTELASVINKTTAAVAKFSDAITGPSSSVADRIQTRLELAPQSELASVTAGLRRTELETARLSPLGAKLAIEEIQNMNATLVEQRDVLTRMLSTLDENTIESKTEAQKLRGELANVGRDLRTNQIALTQAPLDLAGANTEVLRTAYQLASLNPYGQVLAFPQMNELNNSIREEIAILNRMAQSQELTAIETLHVRQAVLSRELSIRENQKAFLSALTDNALSQVAGSVGHRSIIISKDQNLGLGLRSGVFGLPQSLQSLVVGSVDPSIRGGTPRTALQVLNTLRGSLGATSSDSLVNAGELLIKIAGQLKQEFQGIDNAFAEPSGTYASNRLLNVNPSLVMGAQSGPTRGCCIPCEMGA